MNSPCKFRVWDGEEMHEPPHDYVLAGDGELLLCLPKLEKFGDQEHGDDVTLGVADDDHVVMHSTSLTDTEGNEIWEGDLLKRHELVNQRMKDLKHEGYDPAWVPDIVVWSELTHDWGAVLATSPVPTEAEIRLCQILKDETVTVVGNRYENPELP